MTHLFESRLFALIRKEIGQILRNRQLIFLLLFPPTMQLLLYGLVLNPEVVNLPIGVVNYADSQTSRELIAAFTENGVFRVKDRLVSEQVLGEQVRNGQVTAGLVIPPDFDRKLVQDKTAEVQVFIDGVDANTAGIASGYVNQIVNQFSRQLAGNRLELPVQTDTTFLYNPGLISSWFFVPGMMGVVLTLIGSLVSSVTVVREKDTGTLEQLLMTPAEGWEILTAKIAPLFVLLMGDVLLALTVARLVFQVPLRGDLFTFLVLSGLYVIVGISAGVLLATLCRSQQQVVLTSFFVNLPTIQLSGAIAPVESMPVFFQYLSLVNPLRHYVTIVRGILLRGVGMEVLWPNALALGLIAIALMGVSINRFRAQLS